MTSAHIEISGTGRLNGRLRRLVDLLQKVVNDTAEVKATMDQAALGDDWQGLADAFGIASSTDAEAVYNLVGSVDTALSTDTYIAQLLSRLG